jgi:hypothetical protein
LTARLEMFPTEGEVAACVVGLVRFAHFHCTPTEQLAPLQKLGCDQYHCFYRSAAVPTHEIEHSIKSRNFEPGGEPEDVEFSATYSKLAAHKPS